MMNLMMQLENRFLSNSNSTVTVKTIGATLKHKHIAAVTIGNILQSVIDLYSSHCDTVLLLY